MTAAAVEGVLVSRTQTRPLIWPGGSCVSGGSESVEALLAIKASGMEVVVLGGSS